MAEDIKAVRVVRGKRDGEACPGAAIAVMYARSSPRRTPYHASAAVASPVAAMNLESAMCRCAM